MRPTVKLSNGIVVANFSSPHSFKFEDGSILEACNKEQAEQGTLEKAEIEKKWKKGLIAVQPRFRIPTSVLGVLNELDNIDEIDVVLVPLPVLLCLRENGLIDTFQKVGTILVKDRMTKEICINKFCR